MALTLNADLQTELERADTRPVYLVEVYIRPYAANSATSVTEERTQNSLVNLYPIRFCWSDTPLTSDPASRSASLLREQTRIPNIVRSIEPFGVTLDPLNRKVSQGDTSISIIDDGTLRNILAQPSINNVSTSNNPNVANYLYGQKVIIKLGVQTYVIGGERKVFDIANFLTLGTFVISEVLPKRGTIELSCKSFSVLQNTHKLTRNFRTRSPHGQLHEILFNELGLDNTSGTYDESSVDAWYTSQPSVDVDKRHWACKREDHDFDTEQIQSSSSVKDESAWQIINDLAFLLGGFVCERENGKITYVPFNASAAAVRDLTTDDITDFEQVDTYSNVNNQTNLKITSTVKKTDWEPSTTGVSSSQFGNNPIPAYFGGVDGESVFSSKILDAQRAHRFPDYGANTARINREVTFSTNLKWEGGVTSVGFLKPRVVTYGSMVATGETNSNGVAQGPATYNHSTKRVTLVSGKVNTTNPPPTSGASLDTYLSSDFVDVTRGPVLRVISTTTVGGTPTAVTDDGGKSVTFKEGRILSIDNSGSTSVLTLADDQLLEFQDNWGTSSAFDWVILEPSYPVPVTYHKTSIGAFSGLGLQANLGIQTFPSPRGSPVVGTGSTIYRNAHFQRYFYAQWAAVTGIAGANVQFAGSADQITLGAPYQELIPLTHIGGPANADQRLPVANPGSASYLSDLRLLYGHDAASTSATSAATYAQLQGAERTANLGISGDSERYAYLKLEYNTTGGNQREIIKCNAAYPLPITWNRWANTVGTQHAGYGVNRVTETSFEPHPNQRTSGQPFARRQQQMSSTFAYRADASSVTIGYTMNPTTQFGSAAVPVSILWDTSLYSENAAHAILPAGRGQFDTTPAPMIVPAALLNVPTNQSSANHYLGPRCTDVTCAVDVSQRILNRAAYGMPVVEFSTSLIHADLQLGDFISITHPLYLRHEKNGSDTGTIFEITRKEIIIGGDSPRIQWQAAWVRQDSAASYTIAENSVLTATMARPSTAQATAAVIGNDFTMVTDEVGNTIKYDNKLEGVSVVWPGSN